MTRKKILLFSFIALFLFVVAFLIVMMKKPVETPPGELRPTATPFQGSVPTAMPSSKTISITGIEVKNFYTDAISTNEEGDVLFNQTDTYQLVYIPVSGTFLVSIVGSPFDTVRVQAEQALLVSLGITKQQACMLTAEVTTPQFANPEQAGKRFALSFCAHDE